jgi:aspartate carbamoyltransferase catalytic subunit
MNVDRLARLKPEAIVLHPGPMNRGLEIDASSADSEKSRILNQVSNGVSIRMAVLFQLLSGDKESA